MSDILEGLRLHATGVPLDGADEALVAGGRRRARRLAGWSISTGSVVVLTVAVLVHSATSGSSSLQINPADTPAPSVATLEPTDLPAPVRSLLNALPTAAPLVLPGQPEPSQPTPEPTPSTPESSREAVFVGHGPADPSDAGPALERGTTYSNPAGCGAWLTPGWSPPGGMCGVLAGPATLRAGTVGTYTLTLCRDPRVGGRDLHFSTRQEVGALAMDGEAGVPFTWGEGVAFSGSPHVVSFGAGDCAQWRLHWLGQDTAGNALPAGDYSLIAYSAALDFDGTGDLRPGAMINVTVER